MTLRIKLSVSWSRPSKGLLLGHMAILHWLARPSGSFMNLSANAAFEA